MKERIKKILSILESDNYGALVTSPSNIFYLTGFKTDYGSILLTRMGNYFFTDARYYAEAKAIIDATFEEEFDSRDRIETILCKSSTFYLKLSEILKADKINTLLVEANHLTLAGASKLMVRDDNLILDTSLKLSEKFSQLRCVKTIEEIQKIELAQKIADKAYFTLMDELCAGITEKQIANRLDYLIRDYGADDVAFQTIAASGPNSAIPHATPTNRKITDGDFLVLDFGALFDGYRSDTTRTVAIGKPDENMVKIYDAVDSANRDAAKMLKSGLSARMIYEEARHTLNAWGKYDKYFTHSLGHGVGIDVHESPSLNEKNDMALLDNMVVTIEPGVYISKVFGVRIEDMLVVGPSGSICLSKIPHKLRIIN